MSLNVHCYEPGNPEVYCVDFDSKLSQRTSDFHAYATKGYVPDDAADSELLKALMRELLTDNSGVERVWVQPFRMHIYHSLAVTPASIKARILAACHAVERRVHEV